MDFPDYVAFANGLAPAYDTSVPGIFPYEASLLLSGQIAETRSCRPNGVPVSPLFELLASVHEQLHHTLRDGRGGSQPRRFDSPKLTKPRTFSGISITKSW